jgi:hypothetical protein
VALGEYVSRSNFYNKTRGKPKEPYIPWHELQPLSETLLQFCLEHGYPENSTEIENIKSCVAALKEGNLGKARTSYGLIHFGKEGFNEWPPNVVYPHESDSYVSSIFKSLCSRWSESIRHVIT